MKEHDLTLQGAMNFIGEEFQKRTSRFNTLMKEIPTFDGLDGEASQALYSYVWGLGNWVTANIYWSYECERYFGAHGFETMKHRLVEISPKRENPFNTAKAASKITANKAPQTPELEDGCILV